MSGVELVSAAAMSSAFGTAGAAAGTAGYVGALTLADVAMAGSALMGLTGAISSGQAQSASARYNAQVAANQAAYERQRAQIQADQQRDKDRHLMAAQRARMGAQGLDMTTGSPLVVLESTAAQADTDYRTILANGDVAAARAESQAALDRLSADTSLTSSWLSAGSTAFSGYSRISDSRDAREYRTKMSGGTLLGNGAGALTNSYIGD